MSKGRLLEQAAAVFGLLAFVLIDDLRNRLLNVDPFAIAFFVGVTGLLLFLNFGSNFAQAVRSRTVPGLGNDFSTEVLPVVSVALFLNLGGASLGLAIERSLFLDMSGTALSAFLLGPWWAATVGMASNLLEHFLFPNTNAAYYAVVNVVGGLFWGFASRLSYVRDSLLGARQDITRVVVSAVALGVGAGVLCTTAAMLIRLFVRQAVAVPLTADAFLDLARLNIGAFTYEAARNIPDKTVSVILAPLISRTMFPFCIMAGIHRLNRFGWMPLFLFLVSYVGYLLFAFFQALKQGETQAVAVGYVLVPPVIIALFWGIAAEFPRAASPGVNEALGSRRSLYDSARSTLGDLSRFKLAVIVLTLVSFFVPVVLDQARGGVVIRMLLALAIVVVLANGFEFAARQNQAASAHQAKLATGKPENATDA